MRHGLGDAALLQAVTLAMDAALDELVYGQPTRGNRQQGCAQGHCNFFVMPLMLAYETLNGTVPAATLARWAAKARAIVPTRAFANWPHAIGNWAIVALTGEFLRFKLGLRDNISDIVEQLAFQYDPQQWTSNGQYLDHTGCNSTCSPVPYDHFPRKYMAIMLDRGYNGPNASDYWELNRRGAWTSLLMQSPWGEMPTGGRSSQHSWNEAVSCVTCVAGPRPMSRHEETTLTFVSVFVRVRVRAGSSCTPRGSKPKGTWRARLCSGARRR